MLFVVCFVGAREGSVAIFHLEEHRSLATVSPKGSELRKQHFDHPHRVVEFVLWSVIVPATISGSSDGEDRKGVGRGRGGNAGVDASDGSGWQGWT